MARKPRSQWSAEYRRRIERAEARGKSRQAARGHKAKEHVARKRREMARAARTGALTSAQKQKIKRFLDQQAPRMGRGTTGAMLWTEHGARFEEKGWAWFLRVRAERNALAQAYKRNNSRPIYGSVGAMASAATVMMSEGGSGAGEYSSGYSDDDIDEYEDYDFDEGDFDDDDGWMLFYH